MNKSREINQLFETALLYFELAEEIRKEIIPYFSYTISDISKYYENKIPFDKQIKLLNAFIAHLSSSSIRICTIYEILNKKSYRQIFKNENIKSNITNKLKQDLSEHIPFLLRDNISHKERGNNNILWQARQDLIDILAVEDIFCSMKKAIEILKDNFNCQSNDDNKYSII